MSSSIMLQVGKIKAELEKLITSNSLEEDEVMTHLHKLSSISMSFDILLKTKIGLTVNNLRKKTQSSSVSGLSKSLILKWKKHLKSDNPAPASPEKDSPKTDILPTQDPVRLKCRSMLSSALRLSPEGSNESFIEEVGALIEQEIFLTFNSKTDMGYKNRVRSRVMNLRDKKNPELRESILSGATSPYQFATMSASELATSELKSLRAQLKKESIEESQLATTSGTHTTQIKCSRCKAHDVLYNQLQTRSADEPMTTFCLCNACGNRWKFC